MDNVETTTTTTTRDDDQVNVRYAVVVLDNDKNKGDRDTTDNYIPLPPKHGAGTGLSHYDITCRPSS
jgi:hypothetical protein